MPKERAPKLRQPGEKKEAGKPSRFQVITQEQSQEQSTVREQPTAREAGPKKEKSEKTERPSGSSRFKVIIQEQEAKEKQEKKKSVRDEFISALDKELSLMTKSGRITPEQAEEKLKAATLIKTGFSDDPRHDAQIFSRAGVAGEKELIGILNKKKKESAQKPEPVFEKKAPPKEKVYSVVSKKEEGASKKSEKGAEKEREIEKRTEVLEKARESYVRAKLKLEAIIKEQAPAEILTDEEIAEKKRVREEFQNAEKDYVSNKGRRLEQSLKEVEKKDLKKVASSLLIEESKLAYDLKTKFIIEERSKEKPWIVGKLNQLHDWYRGRSWKEKLAIGAGLSGLGLAAGVGGATGAIIGGLVVGARGTLSGLGAFTFAETIIKKRQEKDRGDRFNDEYKNYRSLIQESLKESKTDTKKGLIKFLQSRDLGLKLEKAASRTEEELRNYEKSLESRRYLMAGAVGALVGLGASYLTFENIAAKGGFSAHSIIERAEAKTPLVQPGADSESVVRAVEQHANATATIEKSGSISKSAWQLVNEGKVSKEEMLKAWKNSFVEINGVKVPIKDVGLSHAGDQVSYVPGAGGAAGHFEVADYAKDKLSLGTNEDLYKVYEKAGKSAPNWLREAAGHGHKALETQVPESLLFPEAENLSVPEQVKDLENRFNHGDLADQEVILKQLDYRVSNGKLNEATGRIFSELQDRLQSSPLHSKAVQSYELFFKPTGLTGKEYDAIRNMKVGDFLAKRGRSWFLDYFFQPDSAPLASAAKNATPVLEILHQRKLAELIRAAIISASEKNMFIDDFIKMRLKG